MNAKQAEHTVDRTGWAPGPWDGEPDRVEWRAHGFPCLIVRSPTTGALCGYVGVPSDHPFHGVNDGEEKADSLSVHGGITYGSKCAGHICHVPQPGEPDDVWWLGFDCSHAGDVMPIRSSGFDSMNQFASMFGAATHEGGYKNVAFVREETERLAEQLRSVSP